jgi:hypothetical protein
VTPDTSKLEKLCKQMGAADMLDRMHKQLSAARVTPMFSGSYVKYGAIQKIVLNELERLKREDGE